MTTGQRSDPEIGARLDAILAKLAGVATRENITELRAALLAPTDQVKIHLERQSRTYSR